MIMNGIPTGGQFLISAMLSDVIDYDEFLNYKRNEGQFTVFATFVPKIIAIPCQSFPLVGMFLLGYTNPGSDDDGNLLFQPQNEGVKWFIRGLFVFAPLLLVSCAYLVKRMYPIKDYATITAISKGITLHLQGLSAYDPVTNQEVWIEHYSDEEQYLIYLLDQFSHSNLLWLLSPDTIWKRHQESAIPLRKNTLKLLRNVTENDKDQYKQQQSDRAERIKSIDNDQAKPLKNTGGCCSCFDTKKEIKRIIHGRNDVEFGKDADGNIVYVAVADFEAHGVKEGVKRIKIRVAMWIILYVSMFLISVIGVASTVQLLVDADFAFIPAIFCLSIGLTLVGAGFNVLRYRAANEIEAFIADKNIPDEVIAKCIYPKTKGQRGGAVLERDATNMRKLEALLPDKRETRPPYLRSLTNLDLLVMDGDLMPSPSHKSQRQTSVTVPDDSAFLYN